MNANVLVAKKGHIPFFSERRATREHMRWTFSQTYICALFMIGGLLMHYAYLQNQNATRGYNIRWLQAEYRELLFKENLLDIRIAEGKSIDVVMSSDIINKMQDSKNPSFLVMKDTQLTMNN